MAKMLPYSIVRTFKPKDVFGQPGVLLGQMKKGEDGLPLDGQEASMGVIFGRAEGIYTAKRSNPQGEVSYYYGLSGMFEAIPSNPKLPPVRTNIAWLATHIHEAIVSMLRENDPVDGTTNVDGADTVDFSFEVFIKSNRKSSAGFTWEYRSIKDLSVGSDPLAHLRAELPPVYVGVTHQLEHKSDVDAGDGKDRGDDVVDVNTHGNAAHNAAMPVSQTMKGKR